MKSIFTVLGIFISLTIGYTQNKFYENLESYNLKGKVKSISTFTLVEVESGWERGSEYYQSYGNNFDEVGRLIEYTEGFTSCIEAKGSPTIKYTYFYDSSGCHSRMESSNCAEPWLEWKYSCIDLKVDTVFIYVENKLISANAYTYNQRGLIENFYNIDYPENEITKECKYTYNSEGKISMENWITHYMGDSATIEFSYDKAGNLMERNGVGTLHHGTWGESDPHYSYEYDKQGNVVTEKDINTDGTYSEKTFQYDYDEQGNWTKKSTFRLGELYEVEEREIVYY